MILQVAISATQTVDSTIYALSSAPLLLQETVNCAQGLSSEIYYKPVVMVKGDRLRLYAEATEGDVYDIKMPAGSMFKLYAAEEEVIYTFRRDGGELFLAVSCGLAQAAKQEVAAEG